MFHEKILQTPTKNTIFHGKIMTDTIEKKTQFSMGKLEKTRRFYGHFTMVLHRSPGPRSPPRDLPGIGAGGGRQHLEAPGEKKSRWLVTIWKNTQ